MNTATRTGIVVVGSANMDIVFTVERIPQPGETVLASSTAKYPGGKGLNQAVAAARAGFPTRFVGALGSDEHGEELLATMRGAGIDSRDVRRVPGASGQAFIVVGESAENTIIVASGANGSVTRLSAVERTSVASAAVLLMQLELPLDVVVESARLAHDSDTEVILNAAPATVLPDSLMDHVDFLIVNEHEACLLGDSPKPLEASERLASRVPQLVVTLGREGSVVYQGGNLTSRVPARNVKAVDTTGAGDTYCGAFAAAIAERQTLDSAIAFATAAAALSVQTLGAVPSIPTREQIDATL